MTNREQLRQQLLDIIAESGKTREQIASMMDLEYQTLRDYLAPNGSLKIQQHRVELLQLKLERVKS